ncbi:vitamin K epoxide reductase family protein [Rhodocaloribacter litoris]|uniref:vitamin K epoxide reductase family protein n=1 Tax=Rhodocaloribacter litoris TaxID=2558931 RepID=UPI0014218818|nr:vitamin K epoxide reductase family protein [Rhodocaloribacter litoris]QXD15756.1 vitamin K epoxide reductase family protein [Rhodocaloribacter litoris]GIV60257.1 MAG: vitamin K epoxide reductase [Rhodothermaceae bacterium]
MNTPALRFAPYRPLTDRLLYGLALFGLLVVVHLWLQTERGFDRGCLGFSAPDPTFDCEAVVQSDAGKVFGVSNVVWGLLFYVLVAWMSAAVVFVGDGWRAKIKQARAVLLFFGFAYSAYLLYVQSVQIGEFCLLCLMSALTVAAMFAVQVGEMVRLPAGLRGMVTRHRPGEPRLYAALGIVLLLVAVADVVYFKSLPAPGTPAVAAAETPPATAAANTARPGAECRYSEEIPPVADYDRFFSIGDPYQGNLEAPVTVIEFFDPNCPHCKALHPVMKQVVEANRERARFYLIPFVVFPQSMLQTEALYVAAQEGKYFEMIDAQFAHQQQGGLDMNRLRTLAAGLGMDPDRFQARVERGMHLDQIRRIREELAAIGLRGVPAVMINGRVVDPAARSTTCLNHLIASAAGTP